MTRDDLIEAMARAMCRAAHMTALSKEPISDTIVSMRFHKWASSARDAFAALEAAGCVIVPREATEEMLDASFGAMKRAFDALPPDHEARKKGWVNGAKAGQRFKHAVRYAATIEASPYAKGRE